MTKPRIGVLRGGPSSEYDVSLQTGGAVLNALDRDKYDVIDIVIDREGTWHIHGLPREPHDALRQFDAIVNALHGAYGEDGKVQQLMEAHGVPFTGSGSYASAMAMNKDVSKEYFRRAGLKVPQHILVTADEKGQVDPVAAYRAAHAKFPLPYVVKPVSGGSSMATSLVANYEEFVVALTEALHQSGAAMVEEFIPGEEATVGVIQGFRGQGLYALPPVEIRKPTRSVFDYKAKYAAPGQEDWGAREIVPATFSAARKEELELLARLAHEALGLSHYSRSDFIIHPHRGIFILETNSLPGLTEASLMPKALAAVGAPLSEFVEHLIALALE